MADACFRFTTNPGLEDVAAEELGRLCEQAHCVPRNLEPQPGGRSGNLQLYLPETARPAWEKAHSLYHGYLRLAQLEAASAAAVLPCILELLQDLRLPAVEGNFCVRCQRHGEHLFHSPDVEREAGAVLQQRLNLPVNLSTPRHTIFIRIDQHMAWIETSLWSGNLSRRFAFPYRQRVALNPVVAHALLQLTRRKQAVDLFRPGLSLLDPFCGSGTIVLEAGTLFPGLQLTAMDRNPDAVAGTVRNLEANRLQGTVRTGDARDLLELYPEAAFDVIVTNPPYGKRLGQRTDFAALYRRFLLGASLVLKPHGRLTLMSGAKRHLLNRILSEQHLFRVTHVRVIETNGIYPAIFVLDKAR